MKNIILTLFVLIYLKLGAQETNFFMHAHLDDAVFFQVSLYLKKLIMEQRLFAL